MSIKVISKNIHNNAIGLVDQADYSSEIGIREQVSKGKDIISSLVNDSIKERDFLSRSKALKQLKLLSTDQYSIQYEGREDVSHKFDGNSAFKQLISEINNSNSRQQTQLTDSAIMLLKQGAPNKFSQKQLIELSEYASEQAKIDLYSSLITEHNQVNKLVVDKLLPKELSNALRHGDSIPVSAKGFNIADLAISSSRAYQSRDESLGGTKVLQLLAGKSINALSEIKSPALSAIGFRHVSSDISEHASSTAISHKDPYSSANTLKTMLKNNRKTGDLPEREVHSLMSVIIKSKDADFILKDIAQSGVLNTENMNKVYSAILRQNDFSKKRAITANFLKNLDSKQSLSQEDLLKLYKETALYSKSQPVGDALTEIFQRASRLEKAEEQKARKNEYINDFGQVAFDYEKDPSFKELENNYNKALSQMDSANQITEHTFAQAKPFIFSIVNGEGNSVDLDLVQISSPAELNYINKRIGTQSIIIPDNDKDDLLRLDMKIALEDYINGDDDRLNIYMTKPISEAIPLIADRLQTDAFNIASLVNRNEINPAEKIKPPVDNSLGAIDATVEVSVDEFGTKSLRTSELKSSYDFKAAINSYLDDIASDDTQSVTPEKLRNLNLNVDIKSESLDDSFKREVSGILSSKANNFNFDRSRSRYDNTPDAELDDILCLPVVALSDKIKTNTIFVKNQMASETNSVKTNSVNNRPK